LVWQKQGVDIPPGVFSFCNVDESVLDRRRTFTGSDMRLQTPMYTGHKGRSSDADALWHGSQDSNPRRSANATSIKH
jgi:hypothetical protein